MRLRAFTLVELLVVIGVIALLISILLPVLGDARKRAAATKCAAHLRDIGNAFAMYASENKGFFPPARLASANASSQYNIDGVDLGWSVSAYWTNFLAKYLTKTKFGIASTTAEQAADARRSILWGCPQWQGYNSTTIGGVNRIQTGYGMNLWPTFNAGYPTTNFPPANETSAITNWNKANGTYTGTWHKQNVYTKNGTSRILVADSRFWALESNPMPLTEVFPPQPNINNTQTYTPGVVGQTMADVYRHGSYPKLNSSPANTFSQRGGKVLWNALYSDGHVETHGDQKPAYQNLRMRFPN